MRRVVRDRWRFSLEWNDSMFIPLEISRDQLMVLINGRAVASRKHHGVSGMIGSLHSNKHFGNSYLPVLSNCRMPIIRLSFRGRFPRRVVPIRLRHPYLTILIGHMNVFKDFFQSPKFQLIPGYTYFGFTRPRLSQVRSSRLTP
jgi:hypothetical protein